VPGDQPGPLPPDDGEARLAVQGVGGAVVRGVGGPLLVAAVVLGYVAYADVLLILVLSPVPPVDTPSAYHVWRSLRRAADRAASPAREGRATTGLSGFVAHVARRWGWDESPGRAHFVFPCFSGISWAVLPKTRANSPKTSENAGFEVRPPWTNPSGASQARSRKRLACELLRQSQKRNTGTRIRCAGGGGTNP
jgi:hypothetical protein